MVTLLNDERHTWDDTGAAKDVYRRTRYVRVLGCPLIYRIYGVWCRHSKVPYNYIPLPDTLVWYYSAVVVLLYLVLTYRYT